MDESKIKLTAILEGIFQDAEKRFKEFQDQVSANFEDLRMKFLNLQETVDAMQKQKPAEVNRLDEVNEG